MSMSNTYIYSYTIIVSISNTDKRCR